MVLGESEASTRPAWRVLDTQDALHASSWLPPLPSFSPL